MSDFFNWLAILVAIKRLPPNKRAALCVDFTERAVRVFENHANTNADYPDTRAYFGDMRDLLLELRRDV